MRDWHLYGLRKKLKKFIVKRLKKAGYDSSFLSKENLLRLQQGMSSMLPVEGNGHPRYSQTAKEIVQVDLTSIGKQVFSESSLKEHGGVWHVAEDRAPFGGQEAHLWGQYQRLRKQCNPPDCTAPFSLPEYMKQVPGYRLAMQRPLSFKRIFIRRYNFPCLNEGSSRLISFKFIF